MNNRKSIVERLHLPIALILCWAFVWQAAAQRTNLRDNIYIGFEPSHSDWIYACGEDVDIAVSVRQHFCPVPNATITYEWGADTRSAEDTQTLSLGASGVANLVLKGLPQPGFKTLQVKTTLNGKEYMNLIKIAFSPDKMEPTTPLPKDFTKYWDKCIAKAREIPLEPKK